MKNKLRPIEYAILGSIVVAGLLTIWRCFYTVDITDESYIYADALATIKGNIPYAHNFTEGAGMSFVTMVFLWIYMKLVPSLSGVVLYMRLCFAILRLFEVYAIYRLLRRKHDRIPVLLGCSVLTVWHYFSNYFSYNTISIWLFLLVSVILYVNIDSERDVRLYIIFALTGVLSALSVFANPFYAVSLVEIVIIIFALSPNKYKVKSVASYCLGVVVQGLVVLVGICLQTSFKAFLLGIKSMLLVGETQSSFNRVKRIRKYFERYWLLFLLMFLAFLVGYLVNKLRKDGSRILAIELALIAGTCFAIAHSNLCRDIWQIGGDIGTAVTYIAFALYVIKKNKLFWFTSLPFITITFLELLCSKGGSVGIHSSFAVVSLVGTLIVLYENGSKIERVTAKVATALICAGILIADVFYVYRDDPLSTLHTRVPAGVYKGLISSEENAKCLPEMEEYLRSTISPDEYIMFRDCVPFAYLMFEAKCCDIKTWDPLDYSYGKYPEATIVYQYFENKGHVPDEIIYIDFGRDVIVSAEDEDWAFNDWLDEHYYYDDEFWLNEKFRVLRFKQIGK